jgi:DinB family protein
MPTSTHSTAHTSGSRAEQLCAMLEAQRHALLAALAGRSPQTLERAGVVGDWSIKNVLAHLAARELVVAQALPERLSTGKTPEVLATIAANEDAWNAAQVAEGEELSPGDQLAELGWTQSVLLQYVRSLDDATLERRRPWVGWEGTVAEYIADAIAHHEREHTEQISAALALVAGELP